MISAREAAQLDRFALGATTAAVSAAGRRPVNARGSSLEFHDFRHYQHGDDPRAIDWSVEARLRQLVVRLYRAEGHVPLHLLVDTSASMAVGEPPKMHTAARAAAALAYVGARRRDPLALATFDTTLTLKAAVASGRPHLMRILTALQDVVPAGPSAMHRALMDYGNAARGPGLAVLVSDLLEPGLEGAGLDALFDALRFLIHRRFSVAVLHVLSADEVEPSFDDAIELRDAEDQVDPVVVAPADVDAYRARIQGFVRELRSRCGTSGIGYVPLHGRTGMDAIVEACASADVLTSQS